MRVLMLSWEYPPAVVGGLGRHVGALATELARHGHDVRVVTRGTAPHLVTSLEAGVAVTRAAADPLDIGFEIESLLAWSQASEHAVVRAGLASLPGGQPDVVHAHDWLVAQSAHTLASVTGAPLITTMHATEVGRHQGWLPAPLNRAIDSVERWLTSNSARVITCSPGTASEVSRQFAVPERDISVIPNGIHADVWRTTPAARAAARQRWATAGPLVVFAGRLVHEKGLQTLLDAVRTLRTTHPGLRLLVAGAGPYEPVLRAQARRLRIVRAVEWLGFVPETELAVLFGAADVCVVPSLYEPFGIVALEIAAAGTPLVAAATGGLADLAAADLVTATYAPGDGADLASTLSSVLATVRDDPAAVRRNANRRRARVRGDFGWSAIAERTAAVYAEAVSRSGGTVSSCGGS